MSVGATSKHTHTEFPSHASRARRVRGQGHSRDWKTTRSSVIVTWPSPSLSKRANASRSSLIVSSVISGTSNPFFATKSFAALAAALSLGEPGIVGGCTQPRPLVLGPLNTATVEGCGL